MEEQSTKSTSDGPNGTIEDQLRELGFEVTSTGPLGAMWTREDGEETMYLYQDQAQNWCYEFSAAQAGITVDAMVSAIKKYTTV